MADWSLPRGVARRSLPIGTGLLLGLAALAAVAAQADARTLTVNHIRDRGPGSLRQAIARAERTPRADTIEIRARGGMGLRSALPPISRPLRIVGPGAHRLTVRRAGEARFRIFSVADGATGVGIHRLEIAGGRAKYGGAIRNQGELSLVHVTLDGNRADVWGGAVLSEGRLAIRRTRLRGNSAAQGGAIFNHDGRVVIRRSRVVANAASSDLLVPVGGAIESRSMPAGGGEPRVVIDSSTLARNAAGSSGGAIHAEGATVVTRSALRRNRAEIGGAITSYGSLALRRSQLIGNRAASAASTAYGGGLYNAGAAGIVHSELRRNEARGARLSHGGGVYSRGSVGVRRSTISANASRGGAFGRGGGIENDGGELDISRSTIAANTASGAVNAHGGGVISVSGEAGTTIAASTVSGNSAAAPGEAAGGGILNDRDLMVTGSTVARNSAADAGANIVLGDAPDALAYFRTSIVADPRGGAVSCSGNPIRRAIATEHRNLDEDGSCAIASFAADPRLLPLADNGGTTRTHALGPGSPAIDAVSSPPDLEIGQRGIRRPVDFLGIADAFGSTDAGALELAPRCQGRHATLVAGSTEATRGTRAADVIVGRTGRDRIRGRGGADRICGRGGRDRLSGGGRRDRLSGGGGSDRITGGGGRDRLDGGSGRDRCRGGGGHDRLRRCER